jgi:hypothetical protein
MDRRMRILPLILAALVLAGCQQAGPAAPAPEAGKKALRFFEPEFAALQNQMLLGLADACQTHAAVAAQFDRCLRERVTAAFDDSGEGRTHCASRADFGEYLDCVATGNTFIDIMRRMTDTAPLPADFWNGGETMIQTLSRSIVSKGVANCPDEATAPALGQCIDRWFEDHLALASSFTKRCPTDPDENRKVCLVEAVMVRFMQDHVPRLTAIGV